jgi:DNA-binding response OmpR family regulator
MNATDTLRGLRVLIAEDNRLIGQLLREMLEGLGCVVIGPIADLAELMVALEAGGFDAALLDVQLGDANVFPAASKLESLGVPFIVTSGGGNWASLPPILARAPRLDKPYDGEELELAMDAAFRPRAGGARAGF